MPGLLEREFASGPDSPSQARGFAKSAVKELLPDRVPAVLCDNLELVVSELVTNAVRAGSPTVTVSIERSGDVVAVRVTDLAEGWPEQRRANVHDTGGRGLPLVSAVSDTWGVRMVDGIGKAVWANLAIPRD